MVKHTALALALPAAFAISRWIFLATVALLALSEVVDRCLAALWRLPDWVDKWLDVRDRCRRSRA